MFADTQQTPGKVLAARVLEAQLVNWVSKTPKLLRVVMGSTEFSFLDFACTPPQGMTADRHYPINGSMAIARNSKDR